MRNLISVEAVIQYYCFWFMILCCAAAQNPAADVPRSPLSGSKQKMPGSTYNPAAENSTYDYYNHDLRKLLDVGACLNVSDRSISFVPPLDGTSPDATLCQSNYSMKMVLFDLQLVELKAVDAIGGSFRAQLQLVLHWVDSTIEGSNGTLASTDCSFLCDSNSPTSLCCDQVWVPPLELPRCEINQVESSTPPPYVYSLIKSDRYVSYPECVKNNYECYGRRIWYLNIDATCASQMNFRNFPFDLQELTIDILNPYASRTWFQLTKGFLKEHIDQDINDINLSPDGKIPGWYVTNTTVSSSCLSTQTWQQTFWAQDNLLAGLANHTEQYDRQHDNITDALNPRKLKCAVMENLHVDTDDSPTNNKCYIIARTNYTERVSLALENYKKCMAKTNKQFNWNKSMVGEDGSVSIPDLGRDIDLSKQNMYRSFSILGLEKGKQQSNVNLRCAIEATASVTTPGIRVKIVVQRYKMFYVVKLILPTVACVAFTFSAFGLQPHQLMGRLAVVVPSAIALTALQALVVSTDIPPVAYIAPSTYIILVSYIAQLLIAFESVLVRWRYDHENRKRKEATMDQGGSSKQGETVHHEVRWVEVERKTFTRNKTAIITRSRLRPPSANANDSRRTNYSRGPIRRLDMLLMFCIGLLYTLTILLCTVLPWHLSGQTLRTGPGVIGFWKDSSD